MKTLRKTKRNTWIVLVLAVLAAIGWAEFKGKGVLSGGACDAAHAEVSRDCLAGLGMKAAVRVVITVWKSVKKFGQISIVFVDVVVEAVTRYILCLLASEGDVDNCKLVFLPECRR